ncbi:hypothetical protein P168DRAFT_285258 [Aspergillus campestris IBT 28561]|uniref:Uncharacterized protein n=1 Tax=Aspergillus campestris (strain IBT 28561) TaxID=1392248 RepID=A0A2I1CSH7_ASPC2|nr:uncharacterized protein P168DRAFT_285258 [Aspergillus campestris IBT 28561]PKY00582.1 hypothetical protein P168DRAFT_285258 [Aspergillus campestris IBT 28561]
MPRNYTRERLEYLWKIIAVDCEIPISTEEGRRNEVADSDLNNHDIIRIDRNFETIDNEVYNLVERPPILFCPFQADILANNPIDPSSYGSQKEQERAMEFRNYNPPADPLEIELGQWDPMSCGTVVCRYVKAWACGLPRPGLGEWWSIKGPGHARGISIPHPLLLGPGWNRSYPSGMDHWSTQKLMEFPRESSPGVYPHVVAPLVQNFNARDNTMLYSELSTIVATMRNRANQPKVDPNNVEAQEALFTESEEKIHELKREFPMEQRFPVLLLSFVGPQHGRLFYACMDRRRLVIRQSRLYSFEDNATAPLDLFARMFLSRPLHEDARTSSTSPG